MNIRDEIAQSKHDSVLRGGRIRGGRICCDGFVAVGSVVAESVVNRFLGFLKQVTSVWNVEIWGRQFTHCLTC